MSDKEKAVILSVINAWNKSQKEQCDELAYQSFMASGSIEMLRKMIEDK